MLSADLPVRDFEYSFDQFNTKKDRVYRSAMRFSQVGGERNIASSFGFMFGPTVTDEVPEVVRYTRTHPNYGDAVVSNTASAEQQSYTENGLVYVDSTFLSMFTHPLIQGNRRDALRQPQTMLVSATTARKYFGDEDPIGRSLDVRGWVNGAYTVTGVFRDVPPASHLRFDFLLPIDDLLKVDQYVTETAAWNANNFITYFELESGADPGAVEAKISDVHYRHRREQLESAGLQAAAHLQPLLDIHLNGEIRAPGAVTGNARTVHFFLIIGIITFVIALVNYVNLATARALDRAREVGVRKAVGAHRKQLMTQFLLESSLINLAALVIAAALATNLMPLVNRVAGIEMGPTLWLDVRFWLLFAGVFGTGVLLSGLYPAFVLSSFKPVTVLKGVGGRSSSRAGLRKALVLIQFTASIVLLAGTGSYMISFSICAGWTSE